MKTTNAIPSSKLPEDGLRFFHGLSNWVEQSKTAKPYLLKWKKGQKTLTKLACVKPKRGKNIELPKTLPSNTLYVQYGYCGLNVFQHLRNAFCHDDLEYDNNTKQYCIKLTDKVKIAGRFSLEAIKEFVSAYLPATKQ